MTAEYSVEEVRAVAASFARVFNESVSSMLTAYAERIEADERAAPVAWMTHHDEPMLFLVTEEAAAYCDDDEMPIPLFVHPPAQAAQVDRARETPRRQQAVETLLELGWQYNSERGWEEPATTAEPAAQGEVLTTLQTICNSLRDRGDYLSVSASTQLERLATHTHSPDAADSGRVDDEEADKAAARAMDRVAAKHGMHALEINPDVTAHHTLRRELVRAGYALAAQGQGEATCKHPLQVAGYSATEDACRKAFREEDGYGEERLRSRDYRVFRDGFFCGVHQLFGNPEELPKSEPAAWIIRKRNTHPMDSIPWCTTHDGDAAEHIERGDDVTPLYTHPAPPASPAGVPDGYTLVPCEPTEAMLEAFFDGEMSLGPDGYVVPSSCWKAMLAAAPSATPEGGEVQP